MRLEDGTLKLLAKGADNMMLPRLHKGDDDDPPYLVATKARARTHTLRRHTHAHAHDDVMPTWGWRQEHLNRFSCEGLRVLVLAEKSIPEAEYEAWVKVYAEPSRAEPLNPPRCAHNLSLRKARAGP